MTDSSSSEILLYQRDDGRPAIEVRLDGETVWVTQAQLVELFQSSKANISEHISNIFDEGEVDPSATVREFRTVRQEGSRQVTRTLTYYNLDVILSVGYRVRSRVATQFRIWASERLREYLVKGFTMDDAKLKKLGGGTYWRELLERIRDIRSSEKVLYRQILDLYATSVDYDPRAEETVKFFKIGLGGGLSNLSDVGVSIRIGDRRRACWRRHLPTLGLADHARLLFVQVSRRIGVAPQMSRL